MISLSFTFFIQKFFIALSWSDSFVDSLSLALWLRVEAFFHHQLVSF